MTVNSLTNIVELRPDEVRKAVSAYLRGQNFNICCSPESIHLTPDGKAEVTAWYTSLPEEELFLVNP